MEGTICSMNKKHIPKSSVAISKVRPINNSLTDSFSFSACRLSCLFDHRVVVTVLIGQCTAEQAIIEEQKHLEILRGRSPTSRMHPVLDEAAKSPTSSPFLRTLISSGPTNAPESRSQSSNTLHPHLVFFFPKQTMWYCD